MIDTRLSAEEPSWRADWYDIGNMAQVCNLSVRAVREWVQTHVSDNCVRIEANERGRPRHLYHFSSHPRLAAHHRANVAFAPEQRDAIPAEDAAGAAIPADDLAVATLRLSAVLEYEERRRRMSSARAAVETCAAWQRTGHVQHTEIAERLPNGHLRRTKRDIRIGGFRAGTLRAWHGLYIRNREDRQKTLLALAPRMKGRVGRRAVEIPDALLELVAGIACSTVRADIVKAVELVRLEQMWPVAEFPDVDIRTWQRRIKERDPRKSMRAAAKGIGALRASHLPDIEVDWNQLDYNARWEIDDVQRDWYAHNSELTRIIRPYAYVVIRSSTRQIVGLISSQYPIIKEQVRSLLAFLMASNGGGIPDSIVFEHGAVACDAALKKTLTLLGITVHLIGMDSGRVHADAYPDTARGNPRGHVLVEANHRRDHNLQWWVPGQVGGEERHTKTARTDAMLKDAQARATEQSRARLKQLAGESAAAGRPLILPSGEDIHNLERRFMEQHNTTPHSGLPNTIDPVTGDVRHMTPNERAASMRDTRVRVLDAHLLPAFWTVGLEVPVTRNGVRVNNHSYGRYDQDLLARQTVTVYADEKVPQYIYCVELGRVVEAYRKAAPGDYSQMPSKRRVERTLRNQYRAAMDRMIEMVEPGTPVTIDRIQVPRNPVADRPTDTVAPDELRVMINNFRRGVEMAKDEEKEFAASFDSPEATGATQAEQTPRRRGGLIARSREIAGQVAVLCGGSDEQEE